VRLISLKHQIKQNDNNKTEKEVIAGKRASYGNSIIGRQLRGLRYAKIAQAMDLIREVRSRLSTKNAGEGRRGLDRDNEKE